MDPDSYREYFLEPFFENPSPFSTSLGLLKVYGKKLKRLNPTNQILQRSESGGKNSGSQLLSANGTMKLARENLLQLISEKPDIYSVICGNKSAQMNQSSEHIEDPELALLLQAAAHLVANKKFVSARKLLSRCQVSASKRGSPTQRIVYHFADALQERIDREWGLNSQEEIAGKSKDPIDVLQTITSLQPSMMEIQQDFPVTVISQFTAIQALFDNVASAKRVHVVDLCVKNGSHWIIMMQALASRWGSPLRLLKITAIGTSKKILDQTGKRLASFARAMNLPFQFNVLVSQLRDIKQDKFDLEDDETVAIFSSISLWTVLPWPSHLNSLLQELKRLDPCVMVLNEIEASMNSPSFLERFTNALLYFSAVFDSLYINFENHPFRKLVEEANLSGMLRNTVATEGQERFNRHLKLKEWRKLFAKFGIVETDLSSEALSQASLLHKKSAYQSYLTLEMDGKSLITAWDGTPFEFVSAWKFH